MKYAGEGIKKPSGPKKYFTISFDDGIHQDLKTIEIFKKYGCNKATFFINTGLLGASWDWVGQTLGHPEMSHIRFTKEELLTGIYDGFDMEVHTMTHQTMSTFDNDIEGMKREIDQNAADIYEITGIHPVGMAWPGGDPCYSDLTMKVAYENTCVGFGRGTTSTHGFDLPDRFMKWLPTCTIREDHVLELAEEFVNAPCEKDMLFYTWTHSYELEAFDIYDTLDKLLEIITSAKDVVMVTNAEFYQMFKNQIPSV